MRFRSLPRSPVGTAFSQDRRWPDVGVNREGGVIRDLEHAFSKDGGLTVLKSNLARDGCIVKTAGVDDSILTFSGPAKVYESQEEAVKAGDVVIIRYKGPRGGPGMQEHALSHELPEIQGPRQACALITDGRFSSGTSGLSIGHVSPEAAEGGLIGLVEDGDTLEIDIPARTTRLAVADEVIAQRRGRIEERGDAAWMPVNRKRAVSKALKAYAAFTTSASRGAVRDVDGAG